MYPYKQIIIILDVLMLGNNANMLEQTAYKTNRIIGTEIIFKITANRISLEELWSFMEHQLLDLIDSGIR